MPIVKSNEVNESVSWILWKIEEEIEELMTLYNPSKEEITELNTIKVDSRKKESLAARLALQHLLSLRGLEHCEVYKDKFGKPHVKYHEAEISMSHTKGYGAAALNLNGAIGIDVEHPRQQIQKIAHKFIHPKKEAWAKGSIEKLTMVWSAKEALYKLHGRTQLIFADQMAIEAPDENDHSSGQIIESGISTYPLLFSSHDSMTISVGYEG